jgi:hypothetical protein
MENSLQIALLSDPPEHLSKRRGSTWRAWSGVPKAAGKEDIRDRAACARESWGQVLGTSRAVRLHRLRAERVVVITGGLVRAPISIWSLVGAIALLTATAWITVLQRILFVRKQLVARE